MLARLMCRWLLANNPTIASYFTPPCLSVCLPAKLPACVPACLALTARRYHPMMKGIPPLPPVAGGRGNGTGEGGGEGEGEGGSLWEPVGGVRRGGGEGEGGLPGAGTGDASPSCSLQDWETMS